MDATATPGTRLSFDRPLERIGDLVTSTTRGLIVKGVLALAFGVVLLVWPAPTVLAIVLTFGTFALVDGFADLVAGITAPSGERSWPIVQGLVSVAAGAVVWAWPGITALALLYVIAGWAVAKGLVELAAAVQAPVDRGSRVLVGITGLLTVAFGVVMFAHPGAGAVALVTLIAALAFATGIALVAAGWELGRTHDAIHDQLAR
jgi:uncharacterized membrane protein HdeD (DUF308 family)